MGDELCAHLCPCRLKTTIHKKRRSISHEFPPPERGPSQFLLAPKTINPKAERLSHGRGQRSRGDPPEHVRAPGGTTRGGPRDPQRPILVVKNPGTLQGLPHPGSALRRAFSSKVPPASRESNALLVPIDPAAARPQI